MMAVVGTLTFNFSVVIPLFVERSLHGNDTTYTLLYSVLSVGSLGGALAAARLPTIEVRTIVMAATAFGVAMLLFSTSPDLLVAFLFALLVGFASVAFMTGCTAIMQVRAEPEMRGRVVALQAIVLMGSTPIGGPVLGAICDRLGARSGVIIGGVAALVAALCGLMAMRRLQPPPSAAVAVAATGPLAQMSPAGG
jgi:MFS family permease